jgi:thioredoxin 1
MSDVTESEMSESAKPVSEPLLVACLCAQWCGVCRDYAPVMARTLAALDAPEVHMVWVDIEDHDEVVGDLDVQNFPTLLLVRGDAVLFFGPVMPHAHTLERLVANALAGALPVQPHSEEVRALAVNVRAFQASGD